MVFVAAKEVPGRLPVPDLEAAEALFTRCRQARAARLVLVSSAAVYEPSHHHPGMAAEHQAPSARRGFPASAAWRRLEARAAEILGGTGVRLTVLRPAPVPLPDGRDLLSRFLCSRFPRTPFGFDPPLQLLDVEDLAGAIARVLETDVQGTFHVAPAGAVPLREAVRRAGGSRIPVPGSLTGPWGDRESLRHPMTVSGRCLHEVTGFEPAHTSTAAIARLADRPLGEEPDYDPFGLDRVYVRRLGKTLFRFLHDVYWRIEVAGMEHVPRQGRAVLTGVHRGFMPWDGVMTAYRLDRAISRVPRFLIHPSLVKFPFLAPYMQKLGGLHACWENAAHVLDNDEILAVFPEGIQGAFTPYRQAYRLGRFGRDQYVRFALAHRAPIVPFVTVGSAETFPILARIRWPWWERLTEWPCLPVTPTMGLFPLPSKWHTRFLEPLHVEREHPPEAADDRATVRAISHEVRRRMEEALREMVSRRRSWWWGRID